MKAFWPHGQREGAAIGANADTERKRCGWRCASTSAPCPPMECPKMPTRPASPGKAVVTSPNSSSAT
ncbi:hypothetical protein D3C72_1978920 [compost metagenome]